MFSKVMKKLDKLSLVCKTKESGRESWREGERARLGRIQRWKDFRDEQREGSSTRPFLNSQFFLPIYALVCSLYKARGT